MKAALCESFGKPVIEIHPLDRVNNVLANLREGKVNLRAVLIP